MGGRRENPKLHASVESHPNVEKHDVRMGHPAPGESVGIRLQRAAWVGGEAL